MLLAALQEKVYMISTVVVKPCEQRDWRVKGVVGGGV